MSLDAFAVFVAFLSLLEIVLGAAAVVHALRDFRATDPLDREARRPLLALVVGTVLAVALASSPLFYLLLASWVPRWPGIMCVEGVRRIGLGSVGAPGWLPAIVRTLDVTKPLLVFLAGVWLVLRRSASPGVTRAAGIAVLAVGALALFDGAIQAAYVFVPKEEVPPVGGCCMSGGLSSTREAGLTAAGAGAAPWALTEPAFLAGAILLGVGAGWLRSARFGGRVAMAVLAGLAAATLPVAITFLADVLAPHVLAMPFHHCIWCAFAASPVTIAGTACYVVAVLCSGWAFVARLAGDRGPGDETPGLARPLLTLACLGFLGAAAASAVIMWTA